MQDLVKRAQIRRYILYALIGILAYFAGDKKLLQTVFDQMSLNFQNQSSNQVDGKIYFIGKYKVMHVVDGDTFDFLNEKGKKDTVRIMAVNTLEMKESDPTKLCFAKKQTEFTKNYLTGKEVFLYADKTQGLRDKYLRILAYVATTSQKIVDSDSHMNNYFFNDYLIETGNADTYRAATPAILYPRFENLKNIAKEKGLGMWSGVCK